MHSGQGECVHLRPQVGKRFPAEAVGCWRTDDVLLKLIVADGFTGSIDMDQVLERS